MFYFHYAITCFNIVASGMHPTSTLGLEFGDHLNHLLSCLSMALINVHVAFIHIIAANAINGLQVPNPVFIFIAAPDLLELRINGRIKLLIQY